MKKLPTAWPPSPTTPTAFTIKSARPLPRLREIKSSVTQIDYKPYEAINNATANYTNVTADVLQRRQALKDAIAATTEALQSATTASEVQKLTGVLIGQNAALAATDKEIDQAVDVSVEQDIENRNDAQKQATAEQEEQKAEIVETFDNYRTNFQLNTQPPMFPTDSQ